LGVENVIGRHFGEYARILFVKREEKHVVSFAKDLIGAKMRRNVIRLK